MHADRVIRSRYFSALLPVRSLWFVLLAGIGLLLLVALALRSGPLSLAVDVVWNALWQQGDALAQLIVQQLRIPRIVLALLAGASLSLAGYLLQTLTRVSIASPSVLGLSEGAGLMVVVCLYLGQHWLPAIITSVYGLAAAALVGALLLLLVLGGLHRRDGNLDKLVFAGLILAAVCKAVISLLLLVSQTDTAAQAQRWLIGSLTQANNSLNQLLLPLFCLLLLLTLGCYRRISLYRLGDAQIQSLGGAVPAGSLSLYLLAAGFTALAVAGAGQIGFVGLVVPHLVRALCSRGTLAQLLGCALLGALLVLVADLAARYVFRPYELPVGLVTAIIGVPCFLLIYLRKVRR